MRILAITLALFLGFSASAAAAPPIAGFTVSNPPLEPGKAAVFTSTSIPHPDNPERTILGVEWDFEGDGEPDGTGEEQSHTYSDAGSKTLSMRVVDSVLEQSVTFFTVVVNAKPTAQFSASPASPVAGQQVLFDSKFSVDPEGSALTRAWDLVADPLPLDFDGGSGPTAQRVFDAAGTFPVTLRVTDGPGSLGETTEQVEVEAAPPNPLPEARFAVAPLTPEAGEVVTFESFSHARGDAEGDPLAHAWELDADNLFDDGAGTVATTTFAAPGSYPVRLRVTDTAGGQQFENKIVTVVPTPTPPPANPPAGPPVTPPAAQPVTRRLSLLSPFPVIRITGDVRSRGARLRVLQVRAPRGSLVTVRCKGKRCPFTRLRKRGARGPIRFKRAQRFLPAGVALTVTVEADGAIGKHTRFLIRGGKAPKRTDLCIRPGARRPSACP